MTDMRANNASVRLYAAHRRWHRMAAARTHPQTPLTLKRPSSTIRLSTERIFFKKTSQRSIVLDIEKFDSFRRNHEQAKKDLVRVRFHPGIIV